KGIAERRSAQQKFAASLFAASTRQSLPRGSRTSRRGERAWDRLASWEYCRRNGGGNSPCLPSGQAGPVRRKRCGRKARGAKPNSRVGEAANPEGTPEGPP